MKMKYLTLASLAAATLVVAGCNKPQDDNTIPNNPPTVDTNKLPSTNAPSPTASVGDALQQNYAQAKEAVKEGKDAFLAATQQRLSDLDQKLSEFERAPAADAKASEERSKLAATLDEKRKQVGAKFDEVKNASQDAWQNVKAGFDTALADLEKSYQEAKAKFQS